MRIIDAIKNTFGDKTAQINHTHTHASTIENLKLLAADSVDLEGIVQKLDAGDISEEQFIAVCVEELARELLHYRKMEEKQDLQNW